MLGCELPEDKVNLQKALLDEHTVVYSCLATGEMWELQCIYNRWAGSVGNCTQSKYIQQFNEVHVIILPQQSKVGGEGLPHRI